MTMLPRGSLPPPGVNLPLSTAGGNLHAQLGRQAAALDDELFELPASHLERDRFEKVWNVEERFEVQT